MHDERIVEHAPDAIRAQHDAIAMQQRHRRRDVEHRRRGGTQARQQQVAVDLVGRTARTRALGMRMVARALEHHAIAHHVEP